MLSVLIAGPVLGGVAVWLVRDPRQMRLLALVVSGLMVAWAGILLSRFDVTQPGMQMLETWPWLPNLGLNYRLGADGLAISLLALNALISWVVIYSTPVEVERPRLYYSLVLWASAGLAGAFAAQNVLLFVLFYELELVPLYFLIGIWGGPKREYAALKFLLYTAISGVLILIG
ncbi:MAG: proton-conducting transporter membrane subunit, partial [Gloeomargarita sp. SKYBB_i_bin120]|nr:NAD(P)H-quinone oxidoreductase subunit D4 [Gloeomargarita sp. SKYB120]MDW8179299.1 proton-conducting transporter membrane subunit [Gloeomargarita sp. SKYBB_i_bin120]